MQLHRRTFLTTLAAATAAAAPQRSTVPIIDCHIHLFDQRRPQGVPYSGGKRNHEPALPARYRRLAAPLGIVGAIELEASPWIEDNLWVLETIQADTMMLGTIGNLQPDKPEFREYLDRYHKNPLFLGIRYGNIWNYDLIRQVENPVFIEGLQLLKQAGLTLDSANPQPDLLEAILKVSDRVPDLRIVIDHLPGMLHRINGEERRSADATIHELTKRPSVFVKLSAMMKTENGRALLDPALYKPALDFLFDQFGEDRVVFGSDWPNADAVDNLPAIVQIAREYFSTKPRPAAEKYFWKNSQQAYRWQRRAASQNL